MTDFLDDFLWESNFLPAGSAVKSLEATLWQYAQLGDEEDDLELDISPMFPEEDKFSEASPLEKRMPINVSVPPTQLIQPEEISSTFNSLYDKVLAASYSDDSDEDNFLEDPSQWSPEESQLIEALSIFTAGPRAGISQIRFPGNTQSLEEYQDLLENSSRFTGIGSNKFGFNEKAIDNARNVLTSLASAPTDQEMARSNVFRGFRVPEDVAQKYTDGDVLDMGSVSSWSIDSTVAHSWASEVSHGKDDRSNPKVGVFMAMKNPTNGTYIGRISKYRSEDEFLTNGKVQIVNVIRNHPRYMQIEVQPVKQQQAAMELARQPDASYTGSVTIKKVTFDLYQDVDGRVTAKISNHAAITASDLATAYNYLQVTNDPFWDSNENRVGWEAIAAMKAAIKELAV